MKELLLLLFIPLFSFAQNNKLENTSTGFIITGNIKGLPDSTMVFLARPGQSSNVLAVSYAQKGRFTLL